MIKKIQKNLGRLAKNSAAIWFEVQVWVEVGMVLVVEEKKMHVGRFCRGGEAGASFFIFSSFENKNCSRSKLFQ